MLNKLKFNLLNENQMYLHDKKVEIPKLTPNRWKQLFEKVDMLPGLIVQVLLAPKKDFYSTVIQAIDIALDEITETISILTEVDVEYIRENVGVNELIEFITKTVKRNRLGEASKNLRSLLPKMETQKAEQSQ
jgi:hypothetical protein